MSSTIIKGGETVCKREISRAEREYQITELIDTQKCNEDRPEQTYLEKLCTIWIVNAVLICTQLDGNVM